MGDSRDEMLFVRGCLGVGVRCRWGPVKWVRWRHVWSRSPTRVTESRRGIHSLLLDLKPFVICKLLAFEFIYMYYSYFAYKTKLYKYVPLGFSGSGRGISYVF